MGWAYRLGYIDIGRIETLVLLRMLSNEILIFKTRRAMKLKDRVAVVTGGAKGIGRAICLAFAQEDAAVVVNYSKSQSEAEATARDIAANGGRAIAIRADVRADAEARTLINAAVEKFGRLDILVNNAGYTKRTPHNELDLLTEELIDRTLATNLKGALYCSRAAIPPMLKNGGGAIVNITSVAGIMGTGSSIIYCSSKAGLSVMTKCLARAFAPQIRVNAIAPGFVDTGFVDWPPNMNESVKKRNHLARIVEAEEIAAAALYLVTDGNALTGQEIVMDGGVIALGVRT